MKYILKIFIISFLYCGIQFVSNAQPGPPTDPEADNPVPITGIEYLIAAGAAFGAKKLYDKKKDN